MRILPDMNNPADLFLLCSVSGILGGILYERTADMIYALGKKVCDSAVNNGRCKVRENGKSNPEAAQNADDTHAAMPCEAVVPRLFQPAINGKEGVADNANENFSCSGCCGDSRIQEASPKENRRAGKNDESIPA